jgi:hypothetical protein
MTQATLPTGVVVVPKRNTGGDNWLVERTSALAYAVPPVVGDVARAVLAHWAYETAWGRGEWNFNVGNRIALPGEKGANIGPQWNKAYDSLAEGVADYLALVKSSRYATAWAMLQTAPRSTMWIRNLVLSGYATAPADVYEHGYAAVLAQIPG